MLKTLWTARTGMNANQSKLDVISNNIANSNTTGYKKLDVKFQTLVEASLDRNGVPVNNREAGIGTGVRNTTLSKDLSQGHLQETMKATDMAIDGNGMFRVTTSDGEDFYTRDGAFAVDAAGKLVDTRGNKVYIEYENGYSEDNVKFNAGNMMIDSDGGVFVKEGEVFNKVAEIPLYTAIGNDAFTPVGDNLYTPADGVQVFRTRDADVYQGYLETSNVDIATEFAEMIMTQRAFQLSSKGITTADEMWGMINSIR